MGVDLRELATNAQLNHWPLHLGVKTDAEKIAYLAEQLREAGDVAALIEDLLAQNTTAQEEVAMHQQTIEALQGEIFDLNEAIKQLKTKQQ